MDEYRVSLEIYNGPLDLLLYLIRREEVDIYDIPISRITEQYIGYMELIKQLDPNLAGEFLVMAATLMEVKTRMLLPSPTAEEGGEEDLEIDPRAELVRQLLEYKAFKDAAADLSEAHWQKSHKFTRGASVNLNVDPGEVDLDDAQVWDLFDAFSNLLISIGADAAQHEIIYDDTPIELNAMDLLDRLHNEGAMTFSKIFEGRTSRSEIVGLFLALLELVRRKQIFAVQSGNFDEIHLQANPNPPAEEQETESQLPQPDQDAPREVPAQQPPTQQPDQAVHMEKQDGLYLSADQESDDGDSGTENQTVGN